MRKIGVSVISMLPYSLGKNGFWRSLEIAQESGFDGLQILPLRGWEYMNNYGIPTDKVISYEDAWNNGTLFQALRREFFGGTEEDFPLLHDWVLFREKILSDWLMEFFEKMFSNSIYVSHDYRDLNAPNSILELCPENWRLDVHGIHKPDIDICWDVEHMVRRGRHSEPQVAIKWKDFLDSINPSQIKLIHVKPYGHVMNWLAKHSYLSMLKVLAKKTSCPIIFEARPTFSIILQKRKMIEWLKRERALLEIFD